MLRSYGRLSKIARGEAAASSDEARDAVFHFFQDAYHLKDWIKNDPQAAQTKPERLFKRNDANRSEVLCLCADLCNGTKHRGLDPARTPKTGDPATAFTGQSVAVRPAPASSGLPPDPALHWWVVSSGGSRDDALTVAAEVVAAWKQWLRRQRLLT